MKALFIVPQIGFNEKELFSVKKILEKNKINCVIASFSKGEVIGKYGKKAVAKEMICDIDVSDYEAFIFVGGMNASSLSRHKCVVRILEDACNKNKIICLLCMQIALFSSKTNVFRGRKATVFKSKDGWSVNELNKNGLIYVDENVVVDGNLISCKDESDAETLGKEIIKRLK